MGAHFVGCQSPELSADKVTQGYRGGRLARAEERLAKATASRDARFIQEACHEAEAAGVDAGRVEESRLQALQIRALDGLFDTQNGGDAKSMERACAEAEIAGVNARKVASVRKRARHLQAFQGLQDVGNSQEPTRIHQACKEAGHVGVARAEVAPLLQREHQLRTMMQLERAEQGRSPEALSEAFREAEIAGISNHRLEAARRRLWWKEAESKLQNVQLGNDVEVIRLASQVVHKSCGAIDQVAVSRRKTTYDWARKEAVDHARSSWQSDKIMVFPNWDLPVTCQVTDKDAALARNQALAKIEARQQESTRCAEAEEMEGLCLPFGPCGHTCLLYS
jgi:hypothetical protein